MSALASTKRLLFGPASLAVAAFALVGAGAPEVTKRVEVTIQALGSGGHAPPSVSANRPVSASPPANGSTPAAHSPAGVPSASGAAPPPAVAMVVGDPQGDSSTVVAVDPGGKVTELGVVAHRQGAALRATTTRDGAVVVNADVLAGKDLSFVGGLFLVREGEATRTLAIDVVHASTPHVLADGRVLVSRGVAGVEAPGIARLDDLTVDAIDPATGAVETVASFRGYLLFIAGELGDEVFLYRIGDGHADLVAVDVRTQKERALVAEIPPFARDFSVDPTTETLVYVDHDDAAGPSSEWFTERLGIKSLEAERLEAGPSMTISPRALPGGDVLLTLDPEKGSSRLSGAPLELGPGVSEVVAVDTTGGFATGTVAMPGALGRPFVADLSTGKATPLPLAAGKRAAVAGFLGGKR